jgi:tetratricopeptide (TPR) repeat protein
MVIKRLITHGLPILGLIILASSATKTRNDAMKATSNSKKAIELYNNAYKTAYRVLELDKAVSIYEEVVQEDPNFFMAYYQLATYHIFHKNDIEFDEKAKAAVECNIELSEGEKIQKKILKKWLEDRNTDVSELGLQLVKLYPDDPDSYLNLGFIYFLNKDYPNAIKEFEKSLDMEDIGELYCGPKLAIVPICMLGYSYLLSDQTDKAKTSFDKYIAMFPNDQNPYDCKADYYLTIKEYNKAYESYMKAYKIDTTYQIFLQSALKAREMNDNLEKE